MPRGPELARATNCATSRLRKARGDTPLRHAKMIHSVYSRFLLQFAMIPARSTSVLTLLLRLDR